MPNHKPLLIYLITILFFSSVAIALFAVIEPLNGAPSDDWVYPYYAKARSLTVEGSNRQFGLTQIVLNEIFFPGRFDLLYVWQIANVVGVAVLLFHIARRVGLGSAAGYLWGLIYLLYIPNNPDQARALYSASLYTFITLMGVASIALLLEAGFWRGIWSWILAISATILGYMTARAYESWIPILLLAPVCWLLLRGKRFWSALALWWLGTGIGSLQFVVPYLQNDEIVRYQQIFNDGTRISFSGIMGQLFQFYRQSFWLRDFLELAPNYLIPSLAIAALCALGWGFWRWFYRDENLALSWRLLFIALFLGLGWVGLSVAAFAFAGMDLRRTYRANFFAAPGQALVILSFVLLATRALQRWMRFPQSVAILAFVVILGFWGGQWYYHAQAHADAFDQRTRSFEASYNFFRQLQETLPHWQDHTLLIWLCRRIGDYRWATIDVLGTTYIYDNDVRIGILDDMQFEEDGLFYKHPSPSLRIEARYTYDQVVLLDCDGSEIIIVEDWPGDLPIEGRDSYQPLARIAN